DPQPARVNVVLVGLTKAGRKGTSASPVNRLMRVALGAFWEDQRQSGLSSGEGLIQAVADRKEKDDEGNEVVVPAEKRLYVQESEFASVLIRMGREGNTLSNVIRQAFDDGELNTLTVAPRKASGAHVVLVCHTTPEELRRRLDGLEVSNGWANRFLWLY